MVIKIRDPRRWATLPEGHAIACTGFGQRNVRIEVNCEVETRFDAVYPPVTDPVTGEVSEPVHFLASVKGLEVIEFFADGPVEVWTDHAGPVHFFTDDGRNLAFVNDGKVSFAQVHQRRPENEQLIYVQHLMLENERRRSAKLEASLEAARLAAEEGASSENGGSTTEGELSPKPETDGVQQPPDADGEGVA